VINNAGDLVGRAAFDEPEPPRSIRSARSGQGAPWTPPATSRSLPAPGCGIIVNTTPLGRPGKSARQSQPEKESPGRGQRVGWKGDRKAGRRPRL